MGELALPGREQPVKVADTHFVLKGHSTTPPFESPLKTAVFGTGCFWGTEKGFWRMPGVYATNVGYAGGWTPNPTYEEVCTKQTGHNEVVRVIYNPNTLSYVDLLRQFWESHDPTQGMGQGNDRGTQYRSGIYVEGEDEQRLAEASKIAYEKALGRPITTEIRSDVPFYYAEDYHQQYLAKPGARQYCSAQPTNVSLPSYDTWVPDSVNAEKYHPKLSDSYWSEHGPKPGCTICFPNYQIVWNTDAGNNESNLDGSGGESAL